VDRDHGEKVSRRAAEVNCGVPRNPA